VDGENPEYGPGNPDYEYDKWRDRLDDAGWWTQPDPRWERLEELYEADRQRPEDAEQ
jgi:hypothetical protein